MLCYEYFDHVELIDKLETHRNIYLQRDYVLIFLITKRKCVFVPHPKS